MPFDQSHGGRIDAREPIGPPHSTGVTTSGRRGQALTPAVACDTDALDKCVDSIAVALGVTKALEDHHADAFAGEHSVCEGTEGPGCSRARERIQLAEDEREIDVGLEIDTAGDREVGPTRLERTNREIKRDQRACTGSINDEAGAREIEAVRKPAGCRVGELAGMVAASNGGKLALRSSAIACRFSSDHSG